MVHAEQNVFVLYLDLLHVTHTKGYSNKYYEEHPHKNNLYGLSKMLSDYGVENQGVRLEKTISILQDVEMPFIVHLSQGFGIVTDITADKVVYYWEKKKLLVSHDEFLKIWTGVVLVGEADENSIEPYYRENRKEEVKHASMQLFLFLLIALFLGVIGYNTRFYDKAGYLVALLLSATGVYAGYLLILKQMHMQSSYADKICSLFLHQGDCNNVLESDAAKLFGILSWSEIGLGYFIANLLVIVCFPLLYPYLAVINVCALPYTLWSVWYQKFRAKQWCALCLLVQVLLWLLFVNNLLFGLIELPLFTVRFLLLTGCIYLLPVLLLNLLVPRFSNSLKMQEVVGKLNNLKADDYIFTCLCERQRQFPVRRDMGILLGNPKAKNIITIITNPHCNPCAALHRHIEQFLKNTKQGFCLQLILTSFNQELEESSKLFIVNYQKLSFSSFMEFLNDWYAHERNQRQAFYEKYPSDRNDERVLHELNLQNEWIKETRIYATPTLLFNGYELPEKYKMEDLSYFQDIDM